MFIRVISHSLFSFILLITGYYYFIVPIFGYTGFLWDFSYIKFFESILFIFLLEKILPKKCNKPSDFLLNIHYLLPILPMLVLYTVSNRSRVFMYSILICFYIICIIRDTPFRAINLGEISQISLRNLLIFTCLSYLGLLFYYRGFNLNFNFFNIYEYREIYSSNLPRIFSYLSPLVSKIFLPTAIFLSVIFRQRLFLVILIICSMLIFGYTQHKGTFFYPIFVISLYYIMKNNNIIIQLKFSYLLLIICGILFFNFNNQISLLMGSIFFRRAILVPAELNFQYFEYFSLHPHVFWAKNFFTFGLIDYPYDLPTANIIGDYVSNTSENYANTGWIGSGFMHFHYIGLFIYSIIISMIMSILDSFSKKAGTRLTIALTTIPMITMFLSSDLSTTLITHGLLVSMIIVMCISPRRVSQYEK